MNGHTKKEDESKKDFLDAIVFVSLHVYDTQAILYRSDDMESQCENIFRESEPRVVLKTQKFIIEKTHRVHIIVLILLCYCKIFFFQPEMSEEERRE